MAKRLFNMKDAKAVNSTILQHALELFIEHGYDGFSMRKLARPMGIAPKTIYNYFQNKDEIFLHLLIKGFEQLHQTFETAIEGLKDPCDSLSAAIRTYIDFGIENANIYNLMFTLHLPKFNDYIGTTLEDLAHHELNTALRCNGLMMEIIKACAGLNHSFSENDFRFELIQIWSCMHGYVANINNTALSYIHENPVMLKESVSKKIVENTLRSLKVDR